MRPRASIWLIVAVCASSALARTFYLSPSGSDSSAGTSVRSAWLTPNHAVSCGDVLVAASGDYASSSFYTGQWGPVSDCDTGSAASVAWVSCGAFDTCRITSTTAQGMWVDSSHWGVQGFEVTTTPAAQAYSACFTAAPRYDAPTNIDHIIFANNVANGCQGSGFNAYDHGTSASIDYVVFVGNIAFNAAQGAEACDSGFGIYQPIAADAEPGTHMYLAGNFSYGNFDPATCASTTPATDGEGFIVDTMDFSQGGGTPYVQQVVVDNNIAVGNGSFGFEVFNNQVGTTQAPIYFRHNTSWGNMRDTRETDKIGGGEIAIIDAENVQASGNLSQTFAADGFGGSQAIYALAVAGGSGTDSVTSNWLAGTDGNDTFVYDSGGFALGSNTVGTSPAFANAVVPAAPSCAGTRSAPDCMAAVIAHFTPTAPGAAAYGYQVPSTTSVVDALFPAWLCNVSLPSGLVTPGCGVPTGNPPDGGTSTDGGSPDAGGSADGGSTPDAGSHPSDAGSFPGSDAGTVERVVGGSFGCSTAPLVLAWPLGLLGAATRRHRPKA